jgi:hypothetical protein
MERALQPHRFLETKLVPGAAAARSLDRAKAAVRQAGGAAGGGLPSEQVIELGRARVSLLELVSPALTEGKQPRYEEREAQEAWLPLADARGETVGQVRVRFEGVELLRLLHAANRFRQAEAFGLGTGAGGGGGEGEGGGAGGPSGGGEGEAMDMVDALRDRLMLATVRHARERGELSLTSFTTTPVAAELRLLMPRLSGPGRRSNPNPNPDPDPNRNPNPSPSPSPSPSPYPSPNTNLKPNPDPNPNPHPHPHPHPNS